MILSSRNGQRIIFQLDRANGKLAFADDAGTPEERLDAKQHLLCIHGFCHIVVSAGEKSVSFVRGKLLCRDHQNRKCISGGAQLTGQCIAVHTGHHDVQQDQVDVVGVQKLECFFCVACGQDGVFRALQNGLHQLSCVCVVLDDENVKHGAFLRTIGLRFFARWYGLMET
ncbi:hypothetical protein SDC9_121930 [bioreactor metagenome]|uniref:Uncharacterized protein n=1 Tax=bioreactor metagenome TaxID=1076179 RepID=A0A645CDF1_9ZZZZ